jgi:hypothetical protein
MPGGYAHNQDPALAELVHQISLDGWADDSAGDANEDGFHASLLIIGPTGQPEPAGAVDPPVPAGNWLLTEDEQGSVTLDRYPTPRAARQAFTRLQATTGGTGTDDQTHPCTGSPSHHQRPAAGPCPCDCNRGGWCGGCGHAGCGRR